MGGGGGGGGGGGAHFSKVATLEDGGKQLIITQDSYCGVDMKELLILYQCCVFLSGIADRESW